MRARLLAATLAALSTPAAAEDTTWLLPAPGLYCPIGAEVLPLNVTPDGGMGIDGLDCENVRLEGGRARSGACVSDGGHSLDYDTDLLVLPSGSMIHDGVTFRLWREPRPRPKD